MIIEQFVSLKTKLITIKCRGFFALLLTKLHYFALAHCLCQADMSIITNIFIFFFSQQAFLAFPWFTNFNSPHISSSSSLKFLLHPDLPVKNSRLISSAYCQVTVGREQISSSPSVNSSCRLFKKPLGTTRYIETIWHFYIKNMFLSTRITVRIFFCITRRTQTFLLLPFTLLP